MYFDQQKKSFWNTQARICYIILVFKAISRQLCSLLITTASPINLALREHNLLVKEVKKKVIILKCYTY